MADLKEQRICIKFCFLLGKTSAETVTLLRGAFKEEALSQTRVYEWVSRFKRGDMSLEDQPRSGRPSTSRTDENIQKIRDAIMFDRRLSGTDRCHPQEDKVLWMTSISPTRRFSAKITS